MDPTARQVIEAMPAQFKAEQAGDLTADLQFEFTGQEPGTYYLHIEGGQCSFHESAAANPAVTIQCKSEVWLKIATGKLDAFQAFMLGNLSMCGDVALALRIQKLFGQ